MFHITTREKQIIELLAKGLSTCEIGKKLNISEHTVFSHKQNLFKKLDVANSVSLVIKAYVNLLVDIEMIDDFYHHESY